MAYRISAVGRSGERRPAIISDGGKGLVSAHDDETPAEFATATDAAVALAKATAYVAVGSLGGGYAAGDVVVAMIDKMQFRLEEVLPTAPVAN